MTDLGQRLAQLTPQQRLQLSRRLRTQAPKPEPIPLASRASGRLQMSYAQRRLYFLQQLHPQSPAYNNVEAFRLKGKLDLAALRAALAVVVARHEVLRTTCSPDATVTVHEHAEIELQMVESPAEVTEQPFDLDSDFPMRVALTRLGPDDHVLLLVVHHAVSDAWSCRLLVKELFAAYGGAALPALPLQYADFAAWQRSRPEPGLDHWKQRLAGMPPVLELPLEKPRPAVRSDSGADIHTDLEAAFRDRLHQAAQRAGVTPFSLLLTAFGHVLSRHCATQDVVVGIAVSGRERVELETMVGCFINTLPLRLDFTAADPVARVWQDLQGDLAHQDVPFETLVAQLGGERDLSTGQLVQVMFNHYPATQVTEPVPGLLVEPCDVPRQRAKFDLTCTVVESAAGLRVTVNYATELVDAAFATRVSEHFLATLEALCAGAALPLGDAPAADTSPVVGATDTVLDSFEAQARAHPDRVAVRCPGSEITYRDLDERADRLANGLRRLDPGPVGLLFERGIDYIVGMLGAMKAARAYVPLDPVMPEAHLQRVAAAAGVTVVLRELAALEKAPPTPGPRPQPQDAMYVLFTSGSTGQPKGVVVEHRHVATYLTSLAQRMGLPQGLSFALVSTLAADLGMTNLYGALTTGGTLHVLPYEWATDPSRFAGYFREHRIDFMKLVPSHLWAMAESGVLADVVPQRFLVLAGEACRWDLVEAVRAARPGCAIWNHYGPTETTVSVLAYEVPAELPSPRGATVPLGHPLDHVRAHILDPQLRPVPRGAAGELVICGGSVARGYLGQESTSFTRLGEMPAYRSGDRVRLRADGTIEFLGRLDRQIKIRGYRVEPAHVEAVLRTHPAVAEVAVVARKDRHGRDALVAYHVSKADTGPLPDFARANLPPYLVPSAFVALQRLPLTPNGKLDWRALPDPPAAAAASATPPRDARDEAMLAAWAQVLAVEQLGIDDDFFDSGGDSFLAMKLAQRLGEGVRVVSIFQYPTVRLLIDFLAGQGNSQGLLCRLPGRVPSAGPATATIVAVPFGGGTPAAFRELALALPPEFPLYAVELPGHDATDPAQSLESFDTLIDRCVEEIRRNVRGPVIVYGHCVGAALAFAIADRLKADGLDASLVAGGAFPDPRLPGKVFDLWARLMPSDRWRSDRLYRDLLRATGGFTEQLDPAEQKLVLRALRHDVRQSEELYTRLCREPARARRVNALCVVGERDRITEFASERHREWNLLCANTDLVAIADAGHYFQKHQAAALADTIVGWQRDRPGVAPAPAGNLGRFALVSFGQLISMTGSRALAFALGIWVYLQTGSVTQFSIILVTALLPGLLVLPLAGAAADRWDRRKIMIGGELTNFAGTGICLAAYATGSLQLWHIYLAASLGSIATSFQQPAYLAAVAQLVPKHYLGRTNGILQAMLAITQAAGPLLGGALIALIGLGGVMLTDLATVAVAVLTLAAVRFPNLLFRKREESIWQEIAGGLRYIARRRSFVAMVVFFLGYNLLLGFALALLPPMVLSFASTATLSFAVVVGAIGGIAGGIIMALWGGFARRATGMIGFAALTGLGMLLAAAQPLPLFVLIGLALMMASIALINGHWQTMIQIKVGLELQGRILATNRMIANLTEPLGYVAAALLADAVFEPAMASGGWLHDTFGPLLGTGPGRGMALVIAALGLAQIALALTGLRWRTLHRMEDSLPDAIPGPTLTWNRDALQRAADAQLTR